MHMLTGRSQVLRVLRRLEFADVCRVLQPRIIEIMSILVNPRTLGYVPRFEDYPIPGSNDTRHGVLEIDSNTKCEMCQRMAVNGH